MRIRVTPEEMERFRTVANNNGMGVSTWARWYLLRKAAIELESINPERAEKIKKIADRVKREGGLDPEKM